LCGDNDDDGAGHVPYLFHVAAVAAVVMMTAGTASAATVSFERQ